MLRIHFNSADDRAAVYDYAVRRKECGVLTLNMTHNRLYQVPVALTNLHVPVTTTAWGLGTFDLDVEMMHLRRIEPVEVPDDVAVLKAQLAARDAALTAVLELAQRWLDVDGQQTINAYLYNAQGRAIVACLVKHGVHK